MWTSIATAVATIGGIALAAGLLLGYDSRRLRGASDSLVEQVNELLPQTQCAQCGYPGCRPYAAAIVDDGAAINLCPPGGDATARQLAQLLDREVKAVADAGRSGTDAGVAFIHEELCIGCAWCRDACPVDAISGAHHFMHTVITSECTGCELCVPRCPVDCISMVSAR